MKFNFECVRCSKICQYDHKNNYVKSKTCSDCFYKKIILSVRSEGQQEVKETTKGPPFVFTCVGCKTKKTYKVLNKFVKSEACSRCFYEGLGKKVEDAKPYKFYCPAHYTKLYGESCGQCWQRYRFTWGSVLPEQLVPFDPLKHS